MIDGFRQCSESGLCYCLGEQNHVFVCCEGNSSFCEQKKILNFVPDIAGINKSQTLSPLPVERAGRWLPVPPACSGAGPLLAGWFRAIISGWKMLKARPGTPRCRGGWTPSLCAELCTGVGDQGMINASLERFPRCIPVYEDISSRPFTEHRRHSHSSGALTTAWSLGTGGRWAINWFYRKSEGTRAQNQSSFFFKGQLCEEQSYF